MKKYSAVHIAVAMMVKNEEKRLHVTLNSIVGVASSLIIYDTGSTDSTISILEHFSKKNKIDLHIKHGEFVDFSTSRNILLEFVDTFPDVNYVLMLDCNDELRGGSSLVKFAYENLNTPKHAWHITQEWWSGILQKYVNIRFIRPRKGWRYNGVVHEFLENIIDYHYVRDRLPSSCVLYQDRTQDDDKTGKRFRRDLELLLSEYERDPTDARTVFYLAQTYACLNDELNAYKYYEIRAAMLHFPEERYEAMLNCGKIAAGQLSKKEYFERGISETTVKLDEIKYRKEKIELDKNPEDTLDYKRQLAHVELCLKQISEILGRPAPDCDLDAAVTQLEKEKEYLEKGLKEYSNQIKFEWKDALIWFMDAIQVFPRIEAYVEITKYYFTKQQFALAYSFIHTACILELPEDSCLFSSKIYYDYERWHLLGILADHVNQIDEGIRACTIAIKAQNRDIDKHNLEVYRKKLKSHRRAGRKMRR